MVLWLAAVVCSLMHCCYGFLTVVPSTHAHAHASRGKPILPASDTKIVDSGAAPFGNGSEVLNVVQMFDEFALRSVVDRLHMNTVPVKPGLRDALLRRSCFSEFREVVERACTPGENYSILVYGQRGVGKTTTVLASLQDMNGIIRMVYSGNGFDFIQRCERAISKISSLKSDRAYPEDRLKAVLVAYQARYKRRPIVIVEIDREMDPPAFKQFLLEIKELGFEDMLAVCIMVMPTSQSALGKIIGMSELRVRGYAAPDFDHDEAQWYVIARLNCSVETANIIISNIGTRPMHLSQFCVKCARTPQTDASLYETSIIYRKTHVSLAGAVLRAFVNNSIRDNGADLVKIRTFFKQLFENGLRMSGFSLHITTDTPQLQDYISM